MFTSLAEVCENAGLPVSDRYSLREVAALLGVSKKTVARLTREGTLPSVRLSQRRAWVFASDLTTFLVERYSRGAGEVKA